MLTFIGRIRGGLGYYSSSNIYNNLHKDDDYRTAQNTLAALLLLALKIILLYFTDDLISRNIVLRIELYQTE